MFSRRKQLIKRLDAINTQPEEWLQKNSHRRNNITKRQLGKISFTLTHGYPSLPKTDMTVDEFKEMKPKIKRSFGTSVIFKAAQLKDGFGIDFYTPDDFLEVGKHRLILPNKGEPEYTKRAVDVDIQKIASSPVDAVGVEEIAAVPLIELTLGHCLGAIAVERSYGWQNAYH